MIGFWASILCFISFLQSDSARQPTEVVVRLVYLDSGKPANGESFIFFEGKPSMASTVRNTQITGSDGTVRIRLSTPPPEHVWVDDNNGRITNCAWEDQLSVSEILSEGVTIGKDNRFGSSCKGGQDTITRLGAKPGEIVIFVRKVSNWDNLRQY
jgi:hypothetical protein